MVLCILACHGHNELLTHASAEFSKANITNMLHIMLETVLGMTACLTCSQVCNMVETGAKAESGGAATCQLTVGTLDAELEPLILSKAAQHGLAPSWVTGLARFDPHRRQVSILFSHSCLQSVNLYTPCQPSIHSSIEHVSCPWIRCEQS